MQLIIRTLPEPFNAKYRCVFGNSTPIDAEILEHGLACATPPIDQRPTIANNKDHVLVPLSVRSSETNKDFVSRSFAFSIVRIISTASRVCAARGDATGVYLTTNVCTSRISAEIWKMR